MMAIRVAAASGAVTACFAAPTLRVDGCPHRILESASILPFVLVFGSAPVGEMVPELRPKFSVGRHATNLPESIGFILPVADAPRSQDETMPSRAG